MYVAFIYCLRSELFLQRRLGIYCFYLFKVVHLENTLQLRLSTLKTCVNNKGIPDVLVRILVVDTKIQFAIYMDLVFNMLSF